MMRRWIRSGLACVPVLAAAAASSMAAPPSGPLKDWPCPQPWVEALTAEALYGKALPAPLPQTVDWHADPLVRPVVEFAVATENSPALGAEKIASLAGSSGPQKQERLLLALSGILDLTNTLRHLIYQGIGDQVVRSRLIADEMAANDKEARGLVDDGSNAAMQRKKDLATAQFWNRRFLGSAEDDAELLCHRLGYSVKKTQLLVDAIRQQLDMR